MRYENDKDIKFEQNKMQDQMTKQKQEQKLQVKMGDLHKDTGEEYEIRKRQSKSND